MENLNLHVDIQQRTLEDLRKILSTLLSEVAQTRSQSSTPSIKKGESDETSTILKEMLKMRDKEAGMARSKFKKIEMLVLNGSDLDA